MFNLRFFSSLLFCLFVHIVCFAAPPGNDVVAGVVTLTPSFTSNPIINGDLTDATKSTANNALKITATNVDVWYTFTSNSNNQYISIIGKSSSFRPAFQIFTGTPSALVLVGTGAAYSSTSSSSIKQLITNSSLNPVYYVRVFHNTTTLPSDKTFSIEVLNPPTNDECAGAIVLTPGIPGENCTSITGDNTRATGTSPAITSCSGSADDDVWYSFVATSTNHVLDVKGGSSYTPVIQIFNGSNCPIDATNVINCNKASGTNKTASITYNNFLVGSTYYFRIYDNANTPSTTPTFDICLKTPPTNDECGNDAIELFPESGSVCNEFSSSFQYATKSSQASSSSCTTPTNDVWFQFKPAAVNQWIRVLGEAGVNVAFQVFSSCGGTNMNCINVQNAGKVDSVAVTGLNTSNYYYLRVFDADNSPTTSAFNFKVCIFSPPVNDDCSGAVSLSSNKVCTTTDGELYYSSKTTPAPSSQDKNDVWYSFVAKTASHYINVYGHDQKYQSGIEVYQGTCGTATFTKLTTANNLFTNSVTSMSATVTGLSPNQTYYYRVFNSGTNAIDTTTFSTCVLDFIPNNECIGADTLIAGNPGETCFPYEGKMQGATLSTNTASCSSTNSDIWYIFKATNKTHFITATGGTDLNVAFQFYPIARNCSSSSLPCVNASNPANGGTESKSFSVLTVGDWYYIRVYSVNASSTPFVNVCVTTPPVNDDCPGAIELKPDQVCTGVFGDGTFASESFPSKNSTLSSKPFGDANDDVWYKFKADTTVAFISVSASTTYNAVVEVFEGPNCPTSSATSKLINDNNFNPDQFGNVAVLGLTKNQTYYYRVYDIGSSNKDYSFSTCVVNPVKNDDCGDKATQIKPTYACKMLDGDGTYASKSSAPTSTIADRDKDVWYKFDATSANYTISINASLNYTPILEVYKNCTDATPFKQVTNLSKACQDDAGSVKLTGLTAGTYYYRIYSIYKDLSGNNSQPPTYTFSTCVSMTPKNDDCGTNATVVNAGDACSSVTSDAKYASKSVFTACELSDDANDDVWFTFTAQNSTQFINIKADDYQYDPVVQLFTKNCVALSGTKFCNDTDYKAKAQDNKVYFTGLTKNTEYMYRVYDNSATNPDTMTFETCVVNPVKNDDCAGAKSVTVGKTCTSTPGDGTYASLSITSAPGKGNPNDDIWFTFVPTKSEMYLSVEPTGKKYDPVVQVFKGPNCPTAYSQNLVAEDVNFPKGSFGNMKLTGLTPGLTYYYCVYDATDANPDTMTFNTCVVEATENDDCKGAINVTPGNTYSPTDGDGTYATQTMDACGSSTSLKNRANDDVWFKFTAAKDTQFITVIPSNPNYSPVVQVFKDCPTTGSPSPLTTNNCISTYNKETLGTNSIIGLTTGTTYYYRVFDAATTNTGKMTFTTGVVNPVSNDECAKATEVTASLTCNSVSGDGTYAFQSLAGCNSTVDANDDVWFKFKPINDSQVIYVDPSLGYDPVVEVFSGCGATPSASITVSNTCNDVRFPAGGKGSNLITGLNPTAPFYYYRVFDAKTGKASALTFTTCVTDPPKPPINDDPCNAILINPDQTCKLETYTNEGATASLGIPNPGCAGYTSGDVWFKVKVPFSGQLTFTLKELVIKGAGMAIYSGSCTSLKLIQCEGGNSSMPTISRSKLTPGEFLWIRIWEHNNNNNGTFKLCVTKPNEAPLVGSCANQDFESNLDYWFGTSGDLLTGPSGAPSPTYTPLVFNTTSPIKYFSVMSSGIDAVAGFKTVYNGARSFRLGDNSKGGTGYSIEQYFPVTKSNSSFTYNYAVVLQSGGHSSAEQPFFKVELFDDDGKQIGCGDYLVAAPKSGVGDNIGFLKSPKDPLVIYKPWSTVNINLTPYIGKNVHIRYTVGGCSHSAHFGYVYLECECKPFEISADPDIYLKPSKYCVGDTVRLYAPKGALSYKWKEVGSTTVPSIVDMTTDSLVYETTTAGTPNFTCDVTLFGTSLCPAILPITLDIGSTPTLLITDPDSVCVGEKIDLTDPAIVFGSATNLKYSFYSDNTYSTSALVPDPKNILSGTKFYIKGEKSVTCLDKKEVNVVFNPLPTATITSDIALCKNATNPNLTFTGTSGKSPYAFTYDINGGGNATIVTTSGNSVTVSAPTSAAGSFDYNLTSVKDANGCSQAQTGKATVKVNDIVVTTISCGTPTTTTVDFKWTNNTAATGGYDYTYTSNATTPKIGSGSLPAGSDKVTLNHPFDLDETVTITLTPKGDPCGNPATGSCKTLNCIPPVVTVVPKTVLCHDEQFNSITYTSNDDLNNPDYTWSNGFIASAKIGQNASGIDKTFPTFIAVNTTNEPILDTIFVKAKNSLGCESPAMEHYITVNPKGQVEKPTAQEVCAGQETTKIDFRTQNTGGTTTYPWTNSDATIGLIASGIGDIALFPTINTGTSAKVATITISPTFTNDAKSCVGTETFTITVNPLPKIVATNSGPICGSSANFTLNETGAQATSWSWSSNLAATFNDKTKQNPSVSGGLDNQKYKVIGTDAKGCIDSAKTTLTVKPAPVFTPYVDTVCEGQTQTFKANITGQTYAWKFPDGSVNTSETFSTSNANISQQGKYYITVTDANGCSKKDSVQAVVNPYPVIADINKTICYGGMFDTIPNNTILLANIVPTGTTYTWALPTTTVTDVTGITIGTDQTSFSQNLANPTDIVKNVNYEVTATCGKTPNKCSSKFNVLIKLNPKPSIATINKILCSTQSLDTIPNSTILTTNIVPSGTTYSWLLPSNLTGITGATLENTKTSFNQTLTNTTANPIDINYTITATSVPNPDQCSNTFNAIITVNPTPNISNISLAICSGETFDTIPNNIVNTIPTGTKYTWNITSPPTGISGITAGSNQSSIKQTLKNTTNTPINVTYTITATSGTGSNQCSNTFNVTVTVNPTPTVKAENSGPICANVPSFTLDETATDAVSWKWSSNLSTSTATFDDQTLEKPSVKKAKNGEIFKVVGKDVNGCIDSATTILIIYPIPIITPQEVCVDNKVTLTATHSPATANAWKSEDIAIATIDPTNGEMSGITAGTGKIVYTDDKGCSDTSNVTINALPTITTAPLEVCAGSNLLVKANHLAASTSAWTSSDPANATISGNGVAFGIKTGKTNLQFKDNKGCITTEELAVNIKPVADFKAMYESICVSDSLFLIDKSKPLSHTYIWSFGDGLSSKHNAHKYLTGGVFDITLVTITDKGCMDTMTKNKYIEVIGLPKVTFSFTPDSIDIFEPEIRFTNHSDAKHYKWVFGDGLPSSVQENPIHTFPTTTGQHYTVTLTGYNTQNGCSTSYSQIIVAKEPLIYYIPNTFTPNGDEYNNVFKPIFYSGLDVYNYHFTIYNRWGEVVFESFNVDFGWDGTYGNQLVETATFIWKLEFKEKNKENTHSKTGHVNIIK